MTRVFHALGIGLMVLGVLGAWIDPHLAPAFTAGIALVIIARVIEVRRGHG